MALDLSSLDGDPLELLGGHREPSPTAPRAPLARFEEDPDQPRKEFEEGPVWDAFCDDIEARGILQPVVVTPAGDRLRIRFGARRYRAAAARGLAEIPYLVTDDPRQLDDYSQVAENDQRAELQPLDRALFIAKKVSQGEQKKDIAARLRISQSALTYHLALIDAPDWLLELYHSRRCRQPHILYELRKAAERHPDIVLPLIHQAEDYDRALVARLNAACQPDEASDAGTSAEGSLNGALPAQGSDGQLANLAEAQREAEDPTPSKPSSKPAREPDPGKLKKPALHGLHDGRALVLLLGRRPSEGMIQVRLDDGGEELEVPIGEVTLTQLAEADLK